ncbi:unnamed protein product [Heterobilharzia americana]|nr:unnamed protein product [Heterobilharzia americana]
MQNSKNHRRLICDYSSSFAVILVSFPLPDITILAEWTVGSLNLCLFFYSSPLSSSKTSIRCTKTFQQLVVTHKCQDS